MDDWYFRFGGFAPEYRFMPTVIVVDDHAAWPWALPGVEVVEARSYLGAPVGPPRTPVWSFSTKLGYQRIGYYVALLAEARGQRVWPDVRTIQDLKSRSMRRALLDRIGPGARKELEAAEDEVIRVRLLFGTPIRHSSFRQLGHEIFERLPVPGLEVNLEKRETGWEVRGLDVLDLATLTADDAARAEQILRARLATRPQSQAPNVQTPRFELAILYDPAEAEPPSNGEALDRFVDAAESLGVRPSLITRSDYSRLPSFDALLIRETTAVHHHTFRFARRAEADGLAVIDDSASIFRCCSKVYLAEALRAAAVPMPTSLVVDRKHVDQVAPRLGLPCVLKAPDGSFGRGVVRCNTEEDIRRVAAGLFEKSDIIVAQSFAPTAYDWRIGVLDGEPLYACRYYMAPGHWQIVARDKNGAKVDEGNAETLPLGEVPGKVLQVALEASAIIGDGLYGVDLKQTPDGDVLVIEVNDNPNIDAGVEDSVLGDELYRRIVQSLVRRVERSRGLRSIRDSHG